MLTVNTNLTTLVDDTEQLALIVLMLEKQSLEPELYISQISPLIERLHDKLEDISYLISLQNHLKLVS